MTKRFVFIFSLMFISVNMFAMELKENEKDTKQENTELVEIKKKEDTKQVEQVAVKKKSNFDSQITEFSKWIKSEKNTTKTKELSQLLDIDLEKVDITVNTVLGLIDTFLKKENLEKEAVKIAKILPVTLKKTVLDLWTSENRKLLLKLGIKGIDLKKKSDVFGVITFMKEIDSALDGLGHDFSTIATMEEDWLENLSEDVVGRLKKIFEKKDGIIKYIDKDAGKIIKEKLDDIERATKEVLETKKTITKLVASCFKIANVK